MNSAIDAFRINVARARNLGGLYDAIYSVMTSAIDASDLIRSQIVLSVSALDYYVHEITVGGMLEIFDGDRPVTDSFLKSKVSAGLFLTSSIGRRAAFEADIRERHSYLSFQHPDKIAEAIRLFCAKPLWREVATQMSLSEADVKTRLKLIVDRRNKIAHEADADPSFPGARWPIVRQDGEDALIFVTLLCEAIHVIAM